MNLKQYFSQAFTSIASLKLRSFLAVLGILIGSASIVSLINTSHLATTTALKQFQNLNTRNLSVVTYVTKKSDGTGSIRLNEWQNLANAITAIKSAAPYVSTYQPLSFNGHQLKGIVIGADENLFDVLDIKLKSGMLLLNNQSYDHVCLIGHTLKEQLMEVTAIDPIGQQIRIGNLLFTIIGVVQPWQENGFFTEDINQAVMIPLNSMGLFQKDVKIYHAVLTLYSEDNLDITIVDLKNWISKQNQDLGVFVRSAKQIIASMQEQGGIFTLLLSFIGSIAMLVGGIGIMNIMLISVTERKQEIGIRKAVGATNRNIQMLFLVESILLSLFGGIAGLFIGILITFVVAFFNHWDFALYWPAYFIGFGLSVITGIISGFYPAKKASDMQAIVCLKAN